MNAKAKTGRVKELTVESLDVDRLLLDAENPRLPPGLRHTSDQTALAVNMAEIFDALEIARSIARFGFYPWEVLVVIPKGKKFVVVEGNRRLTAIRGLLDESLREQFDDPDAWREVLIGAGREIPESVPCVVVEGREQATPALGYRHISGIKPWEPQMQARFVAALVDRDGRTFSEVAELTGQTKQWVQETYSTFRVFETAEHIGVDTEPVAEAYSLLTVAMSTPQLRDHIGATRAVQEGEDAIEDPDKDRISELFEWVFGSTSAEPVASESREIRNLARVIGKPAGLDAIRAGLSLEEARQKVEDAEYDPREVIRRDLGRAEQILNRVDLTTAEVNDEIAGLVDAVAEQTQRLLNEIEAEAD
jgi:hypothetical protein